MKFYRQTCQALLWDITFWIQLAYLMIFIKTSWVQITFFWVQQKTTKNEGGLEWNSLFGCIQYTPSFMISYKKKTEIIICLSNIHFVTTEEHFDMVVGSSVKTFSIKRWAWGLFFYSVIKVPNAFYLLNPTPRIAFSMRLLFPHKNTPHHHYVHGPCRRAKVDMTHSQMLGKFEYTGGLIFKVVLEC